MQKYQLSKVLYVQHLKKTQFPLALSWACTIHKVQSLSLEQGLVSFDLKKRNSFGPGQTYTAL